MRTNVCGQPVTLSNRKLFSESALLDLFDNPFPPDFTRKADLLANVRQNARRLVSFIMLSFRTSIKKNI